MGLRRQTRGRAQMSSGGGGGDAMFQFRGVSPPPITRWACGPRDKSVKIRRNKHKVHFLETGLDGRGRTATAPTPMDGIRKRGWVIWWVPLGHYLYGIHHIDICFEGWWTNKSLEVDIGYNIQLPNALNWIESYKILASFVQNRIMQNYLKRNTNHKCIIYQFVFMASTRYTASMHHLQIECQ